MNGRNKVIITYGLYLVDIVTIAISFVLSTFIRFGNFKDMEDKSSHFFTLLLFILFATIYSFAIPWYSNFMKRSFEMEIWQITKMNVFIVLASLMIMYFMKWADSFSRGVMAIFIVVNVLLTFISHWLFKRGLKFYYKSDLVRSKVLVLTQSSLRDEVESKLKANLDLSYQILEVIPVEELTEDVKDRAMQMAIDEIFIYAPSWEQAKICGIIKFFDDMGVSCNYCLELPGIETKRSSVGSFGNYSVMVYNHNQKSYKKLLIKRLMDIVGGLIGCIITVIFTPFVAIAIKLDSKGPVFFSQTRVGRNGRRFKILKFRSMYIDAEERKKELEQQNEVEGLMFKMENDPRITKVGKFIRKTSIDELPQFFNIVKGDMSLVGTRPPTEDEFEKYNQHYRRRLSMTPGLTGLWQVSGRSDIDNFDEVVALDLKYIDNWSLGLDIKILLKTIKVVFTGRGSK